MVSQESAIIFIVSLQHGRGYYEYVGENSSLEFFLRHGVRCIFLVNSLNSSTSTKESGPEIVGCADSSSLLVFCLANYRDCPVGATNVMQA